MIEILLAKEKMEREEGLNHLMVKINPPKNEKKVEKPIAFVLVLDVSYSMNAQAVESNYNNYRSAFRGLPEYSSTKLDYVKQASEKLVDLLRDGDMLGVVSFSDIGQLEYPLKKIDEEERFKMKDRIRSLNVKGSTNVSDGLEVAYNQIPDKLKETHHIKMLLLSDGEANYGIRDSDSIATFVRRFEENGVSVSTIGVGVDYNSYYMETIATASGGMFYHLREMSLLNDIFDKELNTMATLTMKNVKMKITSECGVNVEEYLNGYEKNNEEYNIGNLYNEMKLVYELSTIEEVKKEVVKLNIKINYYNENNEKNAIEKEVIIHLTDDEDIEVNKEVLEYVKELTEAKTKKEALRFYEESDHEMTRKSIKKGMNSLMRMQNSYKMDVNSVQEDLFSLEDNLEKRSYDGNQLKEMYATSYNMMRNEKDDKK